MTRNVLFSICTSVYLLIGTSVFAQSPQAFKYQAIARDASGTQLASTNLNVRILIHDLTASGMVVYMETHNVITNAFGLFSPTSPPLAPPPVDRPMPVTVFQIL